MNLRYTFVCPYCGHINNKIYTGTNPTPSSISWNEVVYCEVEDGGCNRLLVLNATLKIGTCTMKIVGEEER
jgi:hypothetical protein